jgi:hypothetical protein
MDPITISAIMASLSGIFTGIMQSENGSGGMSAVGRLQLDREQKEKQKRNAQIALVVILLITVSTFVIIKLKKRK